MTAPAQPAIITPHPPPWYLRALSFAEAAPHWGKVAAFFVVLALVALAGGDLYGRSQYTAGVNAGATSVKEQAILDMRRFADSVTKDARQQVADATTARQAAELRAQTAEASATAAQSAYRNIPQAIIQRTDPAVIQVMNALKASNDSLVAALHVSTEATQTATAAAQAALDAANHWKAIADSSAKVIVELHEHPPEPPCRLRCIASNAGKAVGYFAIGYAAARLR